MVNPGKIIILNGTSSSGKTCIVRVLQNILDEPYLEAGIDKFIWMMPPRYLERPLWDDVLGLADHAGAAGHTLVAGMHQAIEVLIPHRQQRDRRPCPGRIGLAARYLQPSLRASGLFYRRALSIGGVGKPRKAAQEPHTRAGQAAVPPGAYPRDL